MAALQLQHPVEVVEDEVVSPPPGSVPTTKSLPLTFFDIHWLGASPMQCLFFYDYPYPTLHFKQTTLPILKRSLSLTLRHFFPFAANLVCPPPPQLPYILYEEGDSVPFLARESTAAADFSHLIGDHPRHVQLFQALLPKLPLTRIHSTSTRRPLMAIQVTVFPEAGISIGATFHHVVADGRAFYHFINSWAYISAHLSQGQGDEVVDSSLNISYKPNYNRDLIKDPLGLASIFMKDKFDWDDLDSIPNHKFRVTFVVNKFRVELLKNWVSRIMCKELETESSALLKMSTYVVTCAYMWVCLVKLQEIGTDDHVSSSRNNNNMLCHFIFSADCRDRLKLPDTYFGNCLEPCFAAARKEELLGESGVVVAAKAIGGIIMELDKGVLLRGAEQWQSRAEEIFKLGRHVTTVAASPKWRAYETDFGWGRPRKIEVAHIGAFGSISMAESRDEEGGVEFGLALAQHESDSFKAIFEHGFSKLHARM